MSTKKTTTSSQQQQTTQKSRQQREFDQQSMDTFHQLNPQAASVLQDYMQDPMKASYFNTQLAGANRQLSGLADRQRANLGLNQAALGAAPDPWRQAERIAQLGRMTSAGQADTFQNLLMAAQNLRNSATTSALNYTPLETGQNAEQSGTMNSNSKSVETTGGLGTWLAPVIGAGLGFATGGLSGGGGFNFGNAMRGSVGMGPSGGGAPAMMPNYNGMGSASFANYLGALPKKTPQINPYRGY